MEPSLNSIKCPTCGLVNFTTSEACRRCEEPLPAGPADPPHAHEMPASSPGSEREPDARFGGRSFGRWLLWIAAVTVAILLSAYASLLLTSEPLSDEEHQAVVDAITVLDAGGFSREASTLRRVVSFRRTDNWWNRYVGHATAYAATNFPFGVITLYPTFFKYPVDDIERATILLHESYHLYGNDEKLALQQVWIGKVRLGWTARSYSHTRVWKNTREWTLAEIPSVFRCGEDGTSDCLE